MARLIYWRQGLDSANRRNFGSDIFRLNNDRRFREFGFPLLAGVKSRGINASFLASYEVRENIFIDANVLLRRFKTGSTTQNTTMFGLGVRMNLWAREYDY